MDQAALKAALAAKLQLKKPKTEEEKAEETPVKAPEPPSEPSEPAEAGADVKKGAAAAGLTAMFAKRAAAAAPSAPAGPSGPENKEKKPSVNVKESTETAGDMAQRLMDHANALHAEDLAAIKEQNGLLARIARVLEDDAGSLPQRLTASPAAGAEGAEGKAGGNRRNRRLYGGARITGRRLRRAFGTRKTRKSH